MKTVTILASLAGLDRFLAHFLAAVALLILFSLIYARVTPYPEFRLIKEGKVAPAISFSGALLGFVIPLASAIAHSVTLWDMIIWALIALVVQVAVFLALRTCFGGISQAIAADRRAPAILLATLSLAAGILNAACMSY